MSRESRRELTEEYQRTKRAVAALTKEELAAMAGLVPDVCVRNGIGQRLHTWFKAREFYLEAVRRSALCGEGFHAAFSCAEERGFFADHEDIDGNEEALREVLDAALTKFQEVGDA